MKEFVENYKDRIHGVLSCFDRMLFRGYLPIMSGWQMAQFFNSSGIRFRELKTFLVQNAERVKRHALRPNCLPCFRARLRPMWTRSRMRFRSSSATAPRTV